MRERSLTILQVLKEYFNILESLFAFLQRVRWEDESKIDINICKQMRMENYSPSLVALYTPISYFDLAVVAK